jgi:hypothetical protein
MNDELQKQIVSLIEAAKHAGSDAASFIGQQAPEVIQQMLAWEMAKNIGIALAMFILALIFLRFWKKAEPAGSYDFPGREVLFVLTVIFFVLSGAHLMRATKVKLAPKLIIIEEVQAMVRPRR